MPRIEKFDFEVEGKPEDVAERIRNHTRMQLMPSQGRMIKLGDMPLAGVVRGDRFTVALNQPDFWRRMRAVATGQLVPSPGGTRVVGQAGVPRFWTWYLRIAAFFGVLIVIGGTAATLLGGDLRTAAAIITLMGVVLMGLTFEIGRHVNHADQQARALTDSVRRTLGGGVWPMMAAPLADEATDPGVRSVADLDGRVGQAP